MPRWRSLPRTGRYSDTAAMKSAVELAKKAVMTMRLSRRTMPITKSNDLGMPRPWRPKNQGMEPTDTIPCLAPHS
jgi:hypothetical protein